MKKKMILVGMMVIMAVGFTGCGHHVTIKTQETKIENEDEIFTKLLNT